MYFLFVVRVASKKVGRRYLFQQSIRLVGVRSRYPPVTQGASCKVDGTATLIAAQLIRCPHQIHHQERRHDEREHRDDRKDGVHPRLEACRAPVALVRCSSAVTRGAHRALYTLNHGNCVAA